MLPLEYWKNINLEEFYHPILQFYLRAFLDTVFAISILVYIFTVYIIFTQSSSQLNSFKYTIFIQTTSNIIADGMFFIYCPILHWPLPLLSYYSHFPISVEYPFLQGGLFYVATVASVIAFLNTILFRVLASFQIRLASLISKLNTFVILANVIIMVTVSATMLVPLWMMERNPYELQNHFEKTIPTVAELYQKLPNTFGLFQGFNSSPLEPFIYIAILWITLGTLLFIFLYTVFLIQMKRMSKILSKQTFQLHKMIFKVLTIQMFVLSLLVIFPIALVIVPLLFQMKNGSWYTNFAIPIASLHMIADAFCLLYFVKPYKNFISKSVTKILNLWKVNIKRRNTILSQEIPSVF